MAYTKPQTLDASPAGDTVKTAIVSKLDVNAAQIVADLNTHEALTDTHGATGAIVGTTNTQTLTNKTLTTPVIASLYQDAGKTKLVTLPAASDTLVGKATTDTLTNKTLTSPVLNTGVSGTAVDTDGTLAANSDTILASQKAVKTYSDTKTTLTAVKADTDIASAISLKHARQHAVTSASDHTSTATAGRILKADANGLPVEATNTDTQVSNVVTNAVYLTGNQTIGGTKTFSSTISGNISGSSGSCTGNAGTATLAANSNLVNGYEFRLDGSNFQVKISGAWYTLQTLSM